MVFYVSPVNSFNNKLNSILDFTMTTEVRLRINHRTWPIFTLANLSFINLVSIFRCSSPTRHPVYVSRVDPSDLDFSLSSYQHSYIDLLLTLTLSLNNKQQFGLVKTTTRFGSNFHPRDNLLTQGVQMVILSLMVI